MVAALHTGTKDRTWEVSVGPAPSAVDGADAAMPWAIEEFARDFAEAFDSALAQAQREQRVQTVAQLLHEAVRRAVGQFIGNTVHAQRFTSTSVTDLGDVMELKSDVFMYTGSRRESRVVEQGLRKMGRIGLGGPLGVSARRKGLGSHSLDPAVSSGELERRFGQRPNALLRRFTHVCVASFVVRLSCDALTRLPGGAEAVLAGPPMPTRRTQASSATRAAHGASSS